MQHYRGPPPLAQRSPHANRRPPPGNYGGPPGHHPQQHPHQAVAQAQQQAAAAAAAAAQAQQEREQAKRRAKRPTDKTIPEGVTEVIIGDGVDNYGRLREVERRIDTTMVRKRLDLNDSVSRTMKRYKTLRIWVTNTVENQPWQQTELDPNAFDFSSVNNATYKVRIEGRLIDLEDEEEQNEEKDVDGDEKMGGDDAAADKPAATDATSTSTPQKPRKLFSQYLRSLTVNYDRPAQGSNGLLSQGEQPERIEWKRSSPAQHPGPGGQPPNAQADKSSEFDVLEFTRKGDENVNVTINLVREENPEVHKLSPELADVVDAEEDTKAGVVMAVWEYIKAEGLQEDEEKRGIRCDEKLKRVFKQDTLYFPSLPEYLLPHLLPLEPFKLNYTIRVDEEFSKLPAEERVTIYDLRVPTDDPLKGLTSAYLHSRFVSPAYTRPIAQLDIILAEVVQALAHSKAKRTFFRSLEKDPVGFLKRWERSQRRDLGVILGDEQTSVVGSAGITSGSEVWESERVRESVGLWLGQERRA